MAIGAAIASIAVGGLQALLQAGANRRANKLAREGLDFQKEQADRSFDLASADRVDAFGNVIRYDDILNKWETILTPEQQALAEAGAREQYRLLTEDAQRGRMQRRRQEDRALEAGEVYDDLLSEFRYSKPPSEGAIEGELLEESLTQRGLAGEEAKDVLGRQALRTGNTGNIPDIVNAIDQMLADTYSTTSAGARRGALAESQSRESAHQNKYLPALQTFAALMDSVGGTQTPFPQISERGSAQQGDMAAQIAQAIASGSAGVGNAYGQAAQTAGRSVDLSGIMAGLNQLGVAMQPTPPPDPTSYDFMNVDGTVLALNPLTGQVMPVYGGGPAAIFSSGGGASSSLPADRQVSSSGFDASPPYGNRTNYLLSRR